MCISILMVLVGVVSMLSLPTAQFPNIADPQIQVLATYPGADSQTIAESVATPIEQQMSGVSGMNYMYSTSASNGSMTLTVDFALGTVANTDQILAQMRTNQANSQLPSAVINSGITVQQSTSSPLMLLSLSSPNGTYDNIFLANYANINLNYALTRLPGVASVSVFGAGQYSMRIWVNPDTLANLGDHGSRDHQRRPGAERRESRRPDRRPAGSSRTAIYVQRARARPSHFAGRVRPDHPSRHSRWRHIAPERCRPARTRSADLHHARPLQRQAGGAARHLSDAGCQRAADRQRSRKTS